MKAAIYLKNNIVCKTNNVQKKLKRELNSIEILEEWEYDNNVQKLDEKYNYWNKIILNKDIKENDVAKTKLYHFINPKTKNIITSIYPDLEHLKNIINDIHEYEQYD